MGKKKKKVKAGILKRKQEKKNKLHQRKTTNQQPSNKPSLKKIQNALSQISLLIFQPELAAISVAKEKIRAIYEKGEEMPLQVLEFIDDKVYQQFLEAITRLAEQIPQDDQLKKLALQSILSFMQKERNQQCLNQLVVAKYYQLLSKYQLIPEKITEENILQKIQEYEQKYKAHLSRYAANSNAASPKQEAIKKSEPKQQTLIDKLHLQVKEEISKIAKTEKLDLVWEDLEIFFVDFLKEKEIFETKKITPMLLKKFVGYVKQKLNPTTEDLENIAISLEYIRKALYNLKIFDAAMLQETSKINVVEKK